MISGHLCIPLSSSNRTTAVLLFTMLTALQELLPDFFLLPKCLLNFLVEHLSSGTLLITMSSVRTAQLEASFVLTTHSEALNVVSFKGLELTSLIIALMPMKYGKAYYQTMQSLNEQLYNI